MRDLEFLPPWYPRIRRRRRAVRIQAAVTLLLILAMGGGVLKAQWDVHSAQASLAGVRHNLALSHQDLERLEEKKRYRHQLQVQDDVIARLGVDVETTRLLAALEEAMPPQVSLVALSMDTHEEVHPAPAPPPGAPRGTPPKPLPPDRRMLVRLQGVAPTDIEWDDLIMHLMAVRCFEQVNLSYAREREENGHMMREFEVTFNLNLNSPEGQ